MLNRFTLILSCFFVITSCSNDGRGYEYMPDMYRSPSLETYGQNSIFSDSLNARKPVEGTIARGYLSTFYYDGSLEGYLASKDAENPIENNLETLQEGKELYNMFCTVSNIYAADKTLVDQKGIQSVGPIRIKGGGLYAMIYLAAKDVWPDELELQEFQINFSPSDADFDYHIDC